MAKHKAPTQITVITHEKSPFAEHIESTWKIYAAVVVVLVVAILGWQATTHEARKAREAVWDQLSQGMRYIPGRGLLPTSVRELEDAVESPNVRGTQAEALGHAVLAGALANERDYDQARSAVEKVRELGLEAWTGVEYPLGPDGARLTLAELTEERLAALAAWDEAHASVYENPALPEGSPKVRISTTEGDIVVGLYEERAPKHVANFLKLVEDGFYEDTKFHRVLEGFMIQGGDPNSKSLDKIDEWGQGGPGYKIDREDSGLHHTAGVLSAAKQENDFQSSGSQFFITTGDAFWLDSQHVVYGMVLEGLDVVEKIEQSEVEGDRPVDPVTITGTTRL